MGHFHDSAALRGFIACDWGSTRLRVRLVDWAGADGGGERPVVRATVVVDDGALTIAARARAAAEAAFEGSGEEEEQTPEEAAAQAAAKAAAEKETRTDMFTRALVGAIDRLAEAPPCGWPVVISGMAGAAEGWKPAPYAPLPWTPARAEAVAIDSVFPDLTDLVESDELAKLAELAGREISILGGARGDAEVMRGEETEFAGLAAQGLLGEEGVLILPGTHAKHIHFRGEEILSFNTFMTGELFELLHTAKALAPALAAVPAASAEGGDTKNEGAKNAGDGGRKGEDQDGDGADNDAAFAEGVERGGRVPLPAALFSLRARWLFGELTRPGAGRAMLSGILLGAELGSLRAAEYTGLPVYVAAGSRLAASYARAGEVLDISPRPRFLSAEAVDVASVHGQALWLLKKRGGAC